jgi:PAS domain S-box-containing protein
LNEVDSPGPSDAVPPLRSKGTLVHATPRILHDPYFRDLSHISHDIVLVVGEQGRQLLGTNPRISKFLGYAKKEIRDAEAMRIFADRNAAAELFRKVWSSTREVSAHVPCLHKTGRVIPAMVHARLLPESQNQLALVVIRPEAQQELPGSRLERRSVLSKLLRIASEAPLATSSDIQQQARAWMGRICRTAQIPVAHFRLLGEKIAENWQLAHSWHIAPGKKLDPIRRDPFRIALPPELHSRVVSTRSPQTVHDLHTRPQFQAPEIRDLRFASAVAAPIVAGENVEAVTVFYLTDPLPQDSLLVDVIHTLARELGHAMHFRSLFLRLTNLQDEERRRLASELHDTVAQSLSILLIDLEAVQQEASALTSDACAALTRAVSMAGQSLQEIRTFSYLLHPPVLDALGLLPALRVFIQGFSRRSGIRIISELPSGLPRLPKDWEMAVFRVVQEGLTNVQRHSRRPEAEVRMTITAGAVLVQVINEGASAPPLESGGLLPERAGVGIAGMRERVRAFGGDVNLYSRRGKTILEATIPLPKTARSPQLALKF